MAYYDAISNAIAARGNALAQAAQQQGQVYGNLSANLGQIPFQAMQAGQRRRALEMETQHRELQNQQIQGELDFQKKASAITTAPIPDAQKREQMLKLLAGYPEKLQKFKELEMRETTGLLALNKAREGTPGTMTPPEAGLPGELPLPTRGQSTPVSLGNAFEPVVPLEAQRVHPTLMTPSGQPLNAMTDVQVRRQEDEKAQAAAEIMQKRQQELQRSGIEGQKEVAEFTAGLRPDRLTPQTRRVPDSSSSTGYRYMQLSPDTNRFDIPGPEAPEDRPLSVSATGMTPVYRQYTSPDGNESRMINVKDDAERTGIEAQGWFPGPPAKMSAGQQNDLRDTESVQQILNQIKSGYKKNYVGKMDRIGGAIGSFTGLNSRERQDFLQQIQTAFNVVGKLRSGANWTLPEIERLKQELPTEGMSDVQFESALANSMGIIERKLSSINEVAARTGTRLAPKGNAPAAPTGGGAPKVGDTKKFPNGNIGRWDGKGWEKVQ